MFKIYDRRFEFYQWDLNQKLIIDDITVNQVHFCNRAGDGALVCEVYELDGLRVVDVPNVLLQTANRINVYAYSNTYTKIEEDFRVIARTKPADYVYTETEVKSFKALEDRMAAVEKNGVPQDVLNAAIDDYFVANPIEVEQKEEVFIINAATDDQENIISYDKTYTETLAAIEEGKAVTLAVTIPAIMNVSLPFAALMGNNIVFGSSFEYGGDIVSITAQWNDAAFTIAVDSFNIANYASKEYVDNALAALVDGEEVSY